MIKCNELSLCVCVGLLTSILSNVSDPGQGLVAALLNDLQVAYLYREEWVSANSSICLINMLQ